MAGGTLQILGLGTSPAPLSYDITGSQLLDLIAVKADFDGGAVATPFVPVVEIISNAGHVMATAKGPTVAAGASATVTFATFLGGAGGPGSGNFVQFDISPTSGDYLDILTSGPSGNGLVIKDQGNVGDTGVILSEIGDAGMQLLNSGDGDFAMLNQGNGLMQIDQTGDGGLLLRDDGTSPLTIEATAADILVNAHGGTLFLDVTFFNLLRVLGLPNADPGVSGALWNNAGVVNISP